jgi:hypothetical protein
MSPAPQGNDIAAIIRAAIEPLLMEIRDLKVKVDTLSSDRVTRTDLENVRKEIVGNYVPRDAYEPRHASLVERNAKLEDSLRDFRKEHEEDLLKIHERLESGKQQLEDRMKQQHEVQLNEKDRAWIRLSQASGFFAMALAILSWILQHVKFN